MPRRSEIKNVGIANVQVENLVSLALNLVSEADEITNCITQIFQTLSGSDFAGLGCWHANILPAIKRFGIAR